MDKNKIISVIFAVLAAAFYAINMPCSKLLLNEIPSTILAGLLYVGAGIGMGVLLLFNLRKKDRAPMLSRADLLYTVGMIVLDILAPICLMYGLKNTASANASLLNNFEIVATSVIALVIFKEAISPKLWIAIFLVTLSSAVLTFEDLSGFKFSVGSLFVLLAAVCWGFENNCTRKISSKNTYEVVALKGLCSGGGSLIVGLIIGERFPHIKWIALALLLGLVAYGLSIFFYIKAQRALGAAKTSAYYAIAPFIGTALSVIILKEALSLQYFIGLIIMAAGSALATLDTLETKHCHEHTHTVSYKKDGKIYTYWITHSHPHCHLGNLARHAHYHFNLR